MSIIFTTTNSVEGKEIASYEGIVSGEAIVGAHVVKDIFAGLRDFFGGRSGAYEKTIRDAKKLALEDMEEEAKALGADAIIGIDIDYQVLGQGNSMLMAAASGTAVKFR